MSDINKIEKICINTIDPISRESLFDIPIDDIIDIGNGNRKHCYCIDTIIVYIENRIKRHQTLIDPLNPNHIITQDELSKIYQVAKRKNPKFIPFELRTYYPPEYHLIIDIDPWDDNFYTVEIQINDNQIIFLGYIPSNIDLENTGNTNQTSAALITGIQILWNRGELVTGVEPNLICIIDIPQTKFTWFESSALFIRGIINMEKFIQLADDVYNRL